MEIKILRSDQFLTHHKYVKENIEGSILGEWRNGLAIFREKDYNYRDSRYYLINENNICLYEANYTKAQICRIIGGYYIVKCEQHYNFRTFPGQDRDDEYDTRIIIIDILDDKGKRLTEAEKNEYLNKHKIKEPIELGEGIALYNNSFYRVNDYTLLNKVNKELMPIGKFVNGKLKVSVVSDYRDFLVIVYKKRIEKVFLFEDYQVISQIVNPQTNQNPEVEEIKKTAKYNAVDIPEGELPEDIKPVLETYIEKYYYGLPREYEFKNDIYYKFIENKYGHFIIKRSPLTSYYKIKNKYFRINAEESRPISDKAFDLNLNAPNYIEKIILIKENTNINGKKCDVYKFHCRPYAMVDKDGCFEYNFNINKIQW